MVIESILFSLQKITIAPAPSLKPGAWVKEANGVTHDDQFQGDPAWLAFQIRGHWVTITKDL